MRHFQRDHLAESQTGRRCAMRCTGSGRHAPKAESNARCVHQMHLATERRATRHLVPVLACALAFDASTCVWRLYGVPIRVT
jgi:hypothetical protein